MKGTPLLKALLFEHRIPYRYKILGEKIYNNLMIDLILFRIKNKIFGKPKLRDDLLTVVVISAGRKEYLKRTLESLKKNLIYDKDKILWYIIDDCPDDKETRKYIKSLNFDVTLFGSSPILGKSPH